MNTVCNATKKNGEPCSLNSIAGSDFCFSHDPEARERNRASKIEVKSVRSDDLVIETLTEQVADLRNQERTPEVARALTSTVAQLDKALDRRALKDETEDRGPIEIQYTNDWRPRRGEYETTDWEGTKEEEEEWYAE